MLGDPEVNNHCALIWFQEDVAWLEVPMHESGLPEMLNGLRRIIGDRSNDARIEGPIGDTPVEWAAGYEGRRHHGHGLPANDDNVGPQQSSNATTVKPTKSGGLAVNSLSHLPWEVGFDSRRDALNSTTVDDSLSA